MSQPIRRSSISLLVVLGLLASLLLVLAPIDGASASDSGKVRGNIFGSQGGSPRVKVSWFTSDWMFLGARKAYGGVYTLTLKPGTYWLQFTDQRPAYDVTKYAPTDVKVTVRKNGTSVKNVQMHRGAAITGTVSAGGRKAGGARVVAANAAEQSFTVKANKDGQFALGGLPNGSYSVFTYDRHGEWVGKSGWVPHVVAGKASNVAIGLDRHAGGLLLDLYAGGRQLDGRPFVTAVSRKTGQFWTARATHGSVTFAGLYPGRYRVVVPGVGDWFARGGAVKKGRVKPNRVAFGSFALTRHGGWVEGDVVDGEAPAYPLKGAQVLLFDADGDRIGSTSTDEDGHYRFGGQLRTQHGVAVVVAPDPGSGGWMQGHHYCQFDSTEVDDVSISVGQGTDLDPIGLPHRVAEGTPTQCLPA
ncbi:MAG: hypothetical protein JWN22_2330 [Nocardioides sp.]|jgi:hypothetical protein|nr:hypothetical protein [Nocardioides sp.]